MLAGVSGGHLGKVQFDAGNTDVPAAATRVALSTDGGLHADMQVIWANFKCDPGNTGSVFVGVGDVAAAQGWILEKDDDQGLILPIPAGSFVRLGDINFDAATNGDNVIWAILYQN